MNLPPLPALPVLPPLPTLPPIAQDPYLDGITNRLATLPPLSGDAMSLPLPFEPAPVVEEYKRTAWFPLKVSPFHAGNYEIDGVAPNGAGVACGYYLWDGREWADKLPAEAVAWRGWDRSRWVNIREENPPLPGWYPMRYPRADKKAPSYWDGVQWMYAHPQTGEILAYKMHPNWQAEWFHDGAP